MKVPAYVFTADASKLVPVTTRPRLVFKKWPRVRSLSAVLPGRIVAETFDAYSPAGALSEPSGELAAYLADHEQLPIEELDTDAAKMIRGTVFDAHALNRCGEIIPPAKYAKTLEARAKLKTQTWETALAMQAGGEQAFLPRHAARMVKVCPFTGRFEVVPPVRRANILPEVAQARRAPMLAHLESHVEAHPDSALITLTNGPRLILHPSQPGALREGVSQFHRKISNFNARTRKDGVPTLWGSFGFVLDYRATEFGSVLPLEDGALSLHPHAHCFGRWLQPVQVWPRREWICPLPRCHDAARGALPAVRFSPTRPPILYGRRWRALLRLRRIYGPKLHAVDSCPPYGPPHPSRVYGPPPPYRPAGIPRAVGYRDAAGRFVAVETGARWRYWVRVARCCRAEYTRRRCMFALMRTAWGAEWDYGAGINEVREAAKYTFKGADLERLSAAQVAYLARELRGMRLVSCFGDLAEARHARRARADKGRKWREEDPISGEIALRLRWGPDHNAAGPRDLEEQSRKAKAANRLRRDALARLCSAAAWQNAAALLSTAAGLVRLAVGPAPLGVIAAALVLSPEIPCRTWTEHSERNAAAALVALSTLGAVANAQICAPDALREALGELTEAAETCAAASRCFLAAAPAGRFARAEVESASKRHARAARAAMAKDEPAARLHVVARLSPAAYFDPITRPAVLVRYRGTFGSKADIEAIRRLPFVARMMQVTGPAIAAAELEVREHAEAVAARELEAMAKAAGGPSLLTEFTPCTQLPCASAPAHTRKEFA